LTDINLLIPKKSLLDNDISTLGIWLSGGADSSLLCYLLAKHIKENDLPYKIQTVTIPKRSSDRYHLDVLKFIKKELDCADIFLDPIVHVVPVEEYHDSFHKFVFQHITEKRFSFIYSGINQSPTEEAFNDQWKKLPDIEKLRGEDVRKLLVLNFVIEIENNLYEAGEIRPFFNKTKKDIANLYKEHNLINNLFPLTNSCVDVEYVNGHCGKCWFCKEREWAFGS